MGSRSVQGAVASNAVGAFLVETDAGNGNGEREVLVLARPGGASFDPTSAAGALYTVVRNLTANDVVSVVAQNGVLSNTQSTPFGAATVDIPTFYVGNNNKRLLYVVIATPITWTTSGQPTIQPYVATLSQTGSSGASGLYPLVDTAQNLGSTGTSLAAGTYVFDSSKFASLAQPHLYMGFRVVFPSTPTNGSGASIISVLNGTNT